VRKITIIVLLSTVIADCRNFSLKCQVNVTKDYVFFDWCYNTLSFNEIKIKDSIETDYPVNFEKINAFELIRTASTTLPTDRLKLYFNKANKGFAWKYYPNVAGHLSNSYYTENYKIVSTLDSVFKQNTWYLFDFRNPEFDLLVHCDNAGDLKQIKRKKNTNF
jgi:hypothetical protein